MVSYLILLRFLELKINFEKGRQNTASSRQVIVGFLHVIDQTERSRNLAKICL